MRVHRVIFAGLATLVMASAVAYAKPPFPRIATVNFSQPQNYDNASFQAQLARYNLALLSVWPGWSSGRAMTLNQSVQSIKAKNPSELVFLYISNNEINRSSAANAELVNKIDSMHWWLYPSGVNGTPVPSAWAGTTEVNNTLFTAPDSTGERWVDWYAHWAVKTYYSPNTSIDGFFTDNVFWKPRVNGDWNLDGSSDSSGSSTVQSWYRQGYNRHFSVLNSLMPGKYQIGNISDWGASNADLSNLGGVLNGGMLEATIGYSYSAETWGGWNEMMREYRVAMAQTLEPKLVIFSQVGSQYDYRAFRYGFASCLMDDGYYNFTDANNNYSGVFWFDEFGVKLGNAIAGPSTTSWQSGVYRRDFENGIALVNPKGNGGRTVKLETGFYKIAGSQDSGTNNGQLVTSVYLNDRDGIILLRQAPASSPSPSATTKPQPPAAVTVQ